jgi:hypothetical protein
LDSAFYAYPFWGAYGYYSPYYDSAGGDAYQESEVRRLAAQVDQLNAELARMREEQALREYERELARAQEDAAHRSRSSASTGTVTPAQQPAIPTTLIFRDGKHQDVQNYAVVGKTLWIFNDERAHKVPLDTLDLDATRKANELKGSEFPQ